MLWSSRDLAANTAAKLTGGWFCVFLFLLTLLTLVLLDYDINLGLVEDILSKRDFKEAQAELQQYIVTMPLLAFIEFRYSDEYSLRRTRIR